MKVMPLGDSLTAGGYNLEKKWFVDSGYREKLKAELDLMNIQTDFVGSLSHGTKEFLDREHEGYSGYRINEICQSFESTFIRTQPDIVLLLAGSNDLFQDFELKT